MVRQSHATLVLKAREAKAKAKTHIASKTEKALEDGRIGKGEIFKGHIILICFSDLCNKKIVGHLF